MYSTLVSEPLEVMTFDNRFVTELPGDPSGDNSRRQVHNACYSRVTPTPVKSPQVLACSPEALQLLDLPADSCRSELFAEVFSGNRLLPGMEPFAMCYGGHQFGSWAGQLGDGRAINLGEIINTAGRRWILQLKGAGPTPYSRAADGLAVLRSSIREFICSEAMHHLGIPTTRALSLIATGEHVLRDMFYDGHPRLEPGAVVCRLSPSFLRFGNFEILTARGETDLLKRLADYTIRTDFAEHAYQPGRDGYLQWFSDVCIRSAVLVAHWMRVGFVHGVLNTDNMSILGLTLDYGPYGWLEAYDPSWTPNTTDAHGRRYCYGNQPQVVLWNLVQLANALYPLIGEAQPLQETLDQYRHHFQERWRTILAAKFGVVSYRPDDLVLLETALELLAACELDMTLFFRRLAEIPTAGDFNDDGLTFFSSTAYRPDAISEAARHRFNDWLAAYRARLRLDCTSDNERRQAMNRVNPKFVFRNYLAQLAIDRAEQGDSALIEQLLEVLRHPYDDQPEHDSFARKRPEWAQNRAGCTMLSCSS